MFGCILDVLPDPRLPLVDNDCPGHIRTMQRARKSGPAPPVPPAITTAVVLVGSWHQHIHRGRVFCWDLLQLDLRLQSHREELERVDHLWVMHQPPSIICRDCCPGYCNRHSSSSAPYTHDFGTSNAHYAEDRPHCDVCNRFHVSRYMGSISNGSHLLPQGLCRRDITIILIH